MTIESYKHPYITVDGVILKSEYNRDGNLKWKILLVKRESEPMKGKWCLPGGFMDIDENLENTLRRKLLEKTGLTDYYTEQLKTFDGINRDDRDRVLSVAYLVLIGNDTNKLNNNAVWFEMDGESLISPKENLSLDELGFDHCEIVKEALLRIQGKIWYSDIAKHLLKNEFTIKEVQDLFELVEGKKTGSFRRQLGNRVEEIRDKKIDTKGRPAFVYKWR